MCEIRVAKVDKIILCSVCGCDLILNKVIGRNLNNGKYVFNKFEQKNLS